MDSNNNKEQSRLYEGEEYWEEQNKEKNQIEEMWSHIKEKRRNRIHNSRLLVDKDMIASEKK